MKDILGKMEIATDGLTGISDDLVEISILLEKAEYLVDKFEIDNMLIQHTLSEEENNVFQSKRKDMLLAIRIINDYITQAATLVEKSLEVVGP